MWLFNGKNGMGAINAGGNTVGQFSKENKLQEH